MKPLSTFAKLSDAQLIQEVERLARAERNQTVDLIVSLEEFDRRGLFLQAGYNSLYMYCTRHLLLAEGAAYGRIEAARAARRFPIILERLAEGSITLATVGLIARHLTAANHLWLMETVHRKTKKEVERIVAGLQPKPDVPTVIRRMPVAAPAARPSVDAGPAGAGSAGSEAEPDAATDFLVALPAPRPVIAPLTPERFKLQITMDRETHDTLREIQDLIRHSVPSGDAAIIVARALVLLREQLLRQKAAQVKRPRRKLQPASAAARNAPGPGQEARAAIGAAGAVEMHAMDAVDDPPRSRGIDAAVKRRVWQRDGGQCAFIGTDGRCGERAFLEFHHVDPFAAGGASSAANIELRCRAHNAYEAELDFGAARVRRAARGCGAQRLSVAPQRTISAGLPSYGQRMQQNHPGDGIGA